MTVIRVYGEADVTCMLCGREVGVVRLNRGARVATFKAAGADHETPLIVNKLRCSHCGGCTFVDHKLEPRRDYGRAERPRRGRPPKKLREASLA